MPSRVKDLVLVGRKLSRDVERIVGGRRASRRREDGAGIRSRRGGKEREGGHSGWA
jgi:hypothetical protein